MHNIWQMSQISLPKSLSHCKCMITQQNTENPKVIILCGKTNFKDVTNERLKYDLQTIIGNRNFKHFMMHIEEVISHSFFFCFLTKNTMKYQQINDV